MITTATDTENLQPMKIYTNIDQLIQNEIKSYLQFTDSKTLKSKDEFAVFMNMVRSGKYSDALLKEVFYKLDDYIGFQCKSKEEDITISVKTIKRTLVGEGISSISGRFPHDLEIGKEYELKYNFELKIFIVSTLGNSYKANAFEWDKSIDPLTIMLEYENKNR